jgi:hypothetical protein
MKLPNVPDVRITRDAIFMDGQQVPGVIVEKGVTVEPGGGTAVNRMTVTFLVGNVHAENPFPD